MYSMLLILLKHNVWYFHKTLRGRRLSRARDRWLRGTQERWTTTTSDESDPRPVALKWVS